MGHFALIMAQREMECSLCCCQVLFVVYYHCCLWVGWRVAYNVSFVYLTEEEISANVKASAVEEGSDNDLGEPQEYTRRRNFLAWEEMALMW